MSWYLIDLILIDRFVFLDIELFRGDVGGDIEKAGVATSKRVEAFRWLNRQVPSLRTQPPRAFIIWCSNTIMSPQAGRISCRN
jgi:hypothetical protein